MSYEYLLDVTKTLIGTFAGAGLALGGAIWIRHIQRKDDDLVAGNLAVFVIAQQLGDFRTIVRAVREEADP